MTGLSDGAFEDVPTNDLGWEVYPAGLAEQVRRLHDRYDLAVWVTENGTADNGKPQCDPGDEAFRCRFILDHLAQISHVISEGIPVERYYHWCFVDNWEWSEGDGCSVWRRWSRSRELGSSNQAIWLAIARPHPGWGSDP